MDSKGGLSGSNFKFYKITKEAKQLAATVVGNCDNLEWKHKKFHARNCY